MNPLKNKTFKAAKKIYITTRIECTQKKQNPQNQESVKKWNPNNAKKIYTWLVENGTHQEKQIFVTVQDCTLY